MQKIELQKKKQRLFQRFENIKVIQTNLFLHSKLRQMFQDPKHQK